MSTLRCKCGYIIRDQSDNLTYKSRVLRDQDGFHYLDTLSHELALFAANIVAGKREDWISRHFLPGYPRNLPDEEVIFDYLCGLDEKLATPIFECENCGRLWMQETPNNGAYIPYSPDDGRLHRLFASALHTRSETEH